MWRSLVAHFVRDEGVGGSNPLIPTKSLKPATQAVKKRHFFSIFPRAITAHSLQYR
jgi:hypothetical protein